MPSKEKCCRNTRLASHFQEISTRLKAHYFRCFHSFFFFNKEICQFSVLLNLILFLHYKTISAHFLFSSWCCRSLYLNRDNLGNHSEDTQTAPERYFAAIEPIYKKKRGSLSIMLKHRAISLGSHHGEGVRWNVRRV